jgi:hypothetical protein
MTTDQIFFIVLWIVGIPLGLILLRYEERKSYKDWLEREKDYLNKLNSDS